MRRKGFTLIELLIVVAILGILAAVLLMTINPLEQMARARDGGKITRAKELHDAAERWWIVAESEPTCAGLVGNELKTNFDCTGLTLNGSNGSYTVNFTPESEVYKTKCGGDGICTVPTELESTL